MCQGVAIDADASTLGRVVSASQDGARRSSVREPRRQPEAGRRVASLQAVPMQAVTPELGMAGSDRRRDDRSLPGAAAQRFPYEIRTVIPQTPVRSAPSEDAYPTDQLDAGTVLEVWRHDPHGWLAIRPPSRSFSLVQASHLKATETPDIFEVQTDGAKAWVGTRIDQDHLPIAQVLLKDGERVVVLSSMVIEEAGKLQTWYQIEPPAGEFRWVRLDDLTGLKGRGSDSTGTRSSRTAPETRSAPPDAPLSGYMPVWPNGDRPVDSGTQAFNGQANPEGTHTIPTPLSLNGSVVGSVDQGGAMWRAAQASQPEWGYADLDRSSPALGPADNPLAYPDGNLDVSARPDSIVQPQARNLDENASRSGPAWQSATSVVQAAANPSMNSPGNSWDQAVNRLRQDPIANAVADARTPMTTESGASDLNAGNPGASSTHGPNGISASESWANPGADWNQRLSAVQSALLRETNQPPQQWSLLPILDECRKLWHAAPTKLQQQAAADIGTRIESLMQFQQTTAQSNTSEGAAAENSAATNAFWSGQRFASTSDPILGLGGVPDSTMNNLPNPFIAAPGVVPTANLPSTPNGLLSPSGVVAAGSGYDAVGYLKELLVARGQKNTEYVLQDENGKSICHLAAQPGVNLRNHLDKKVGVVGTKGIHGRLNLPHVNVERIYRIP